LGSHEHPQGSLGAQEGAAEQRGRYRRLGHGRSSVPCRPRASGLGLSRRFRQAAADQEVGTGGPTIGGAGHLWGAVVPHGSACVLLTRAPSGSAGRAGQLTGRRSPARDGCRVRNPAMAVQIRPPGVVEPPVVSSALPPALAGWWARVADPVATHTAPAARCCRPGVGLRRSLTCRDRGALKLVVPLLDSVATGEGPLSRRFRPRRRSVPVPALFRSPRSDRDQSPANPRNLRSRK
jgi:hypothetical protein